jgi:hypothetical protein
MALFPVVECKNLTPFAVGFLDRAVCAKYIGKDMHIRAQLQNLRLIAALRERGDPLSRA